MDNIEIKYSNIDLDSTDYTSAKNNALEASEKIRDLIHSEDPAYKIFSNKHALEQANISSSYAKQIRNNFSDLIVIAMGGASLNPATLISLCSKKNEKTKIHFLNNTDPLFLENLLSKIELKNTAILAISNSGQTLETISLVGVMINQYKKENIPNFGKYFYFITNLESGSLKNIANQIDATLIEHTKSVSGRYSGLTNVSTLAAQVAGINVEEYLSGADLALQDFYSNKLDNIATLSAAAIYSTNLPIMVNIGYLQKFDIFLEWYSQIIAESLGKDGKGITPIRGLGPNDQHSMFQLYLNGPVDKFYSLFYAKNVKSDLVTYGFEGVNYTAKKQLSDINAANFEATFRALNKIKAPVRRILLEDFSAKTIGCFAVQSMLEIIILGRIMQINPFNQPGVEFIKTESRRIIN